MGVFLENYTMYILGNYFIYFEKKFLLRVDCQGESIGVRQLGNLLRTPL